MLFLFEIIILALIQGVGEILPISSSGHLMMVSNLFNINKEDATLELLLHVASLVGLTVYYFDLIKSITKGVVLYVFKKDKSYYREWSYFTTIVISTLPVVLFGVVINNYLNNLVNYVGVFLLINGLFLLLFKESGRNIELEDLTSLDKLKIGFYEIMGLIPGISRSGASLLGCSSVKLNKEDSFNLTFLLLFPLVIGSIILNVNNFSYSSSLLIPYVIAFLITVMVTYISMIILHNLVIKSKSKIFGIYCVSVGVIYSIILLVI